MNNNSIILAGIIAPIFFLISITLLGMILDDYNPIIQHISEIGGINSPLKTFFSMIFLIFGSLIAAFSIGLKKEFKKNVSHNLFFLGAFFIAITGIFPCDDYCINFTLEGRIHTIASNLFSILMPIAVISSIPDLFNEKKFGKNWAYISFALGIVSIIAGLVMYSPFFLSHLGLIQRIKIISPLFWIFLVSIKIYKK